MIYELADCQLDTAAHRLTRDGVEVHVEPQVFDLLALLVSEAPALVTYDQMIAAVWDGRIVSDATLAARISAARAALGDDGKRQAVIRTHAKRGVQVVSPVRTAGDAAASAPPPEAALKQVIRYTTSRDGTAIAWAELGDGAPLLRGGHWMSHLEHDWKSPVFRPLLERLARGRRLVRYDPRGTGLSERSLNGGGLEQLVDDMEAVADAAGLDRFPIYAISQSVPVALAFAARHPERVTRMILNNGLVRGEMARGESDRTAALVSMIKAGWGVPDTAFMQAIATIFMPRSTPEELASQMEMQRVSSTPEIAAELRQRIAEIDVIDILGDVRCPVLVMHTSGDAVQSPEQSKLIAANVEGAEFVLVDSPNHVITPSDPVWGACVDRFDDFLGADQASV